MKEILKSLIIPGLFATIPPICMYTDRGEYPHTWYEYLITFTGWICINWAILNLLPPYKKK